MKHSYTKMKLLIAKRSIRPERKFWQVLSALSQSILTALAVFGYFFTIRPIHQAQLLTEKNAKLEIEGKQLTKANEDLPLLLDSNKRSMEEYLRLIEQQKKQLNIIKSNYQASISEQAKINSQLEKAKEEKALLDRIIETKKIVYTMESLQAFIYTSITDNLLNEISVFDVLDKAPTDSIDQTIRSYLGDPYSDTKELITDFFSIQNQPFTAAGILASDPIGMKIETRLLTELENIKGEIEIPQSVYDECKRIVINHRNNAEEIRKARGKLSIESEKDYSTYKENTDELLKITIEKSRESSNKLTKIEAEQFNPLSVLAEIPKRVQQRGKL